MALSVGAPAPRFSLPQKPGEMVDVGALIGRERIVLLFFPLAFSSVCTEEMCHFRDDWTDWKSLGCSIFGISIDSPFVTDKFRAELNVPFPILSDFNKTVSASYDALHADLLGLKGVTKRAAVVIGSDGKVAYAWEAEIPKTQLDFAALRTAIAQTR